MNTAAWVDGFRTGSLRKLGTVPVGMDSRSWLAGYFEGVDPPVTYYLALGHGCFQINRFDPKEGEPYAVEGGCFRTWRQADEFLNVLRALLSFRNNARLDMPQGLMPTLG